MLLGEVLRVALQSIRANLFRACLTMLGIIIGVAAVITMLAAGSGAQQRIEEQLDALGANLLNITADRPFFLRGVARAQLTLEVEDVTALQEKSQYLDTVVPTLEGRNQVKYGNKNINVRVLGTTQEYPTYSTTGWRPEGCLPRKKTTTGNASPYWVVEFQGSWKSTRQNYSPRESLSAEYPSPSSAFWRR